MKWRKLAEHLQHVNSLGKWEFYLSPASDCGSSVRRPCSLVFSVTTTTTTTTEVGFTKKQPLHTSYSCRYYSRISDKNWTYLLFVSKCCSSVDPWPLLCLDWDSVRKRLILSEGIAKEIPAVTFRVLMPITSPSWKKKQHTRMYKEQLVAGSQILSKCWHTKIWQDMKETCLIQA